MVCHQLLNVLIVFTYGPLCHCNDLLPKEVSWYYLLNILK